jgi:hypothetical protein
MAKVEIKITRNVNMSNGGIEIDGERDYEVTVAVDEGVVARYGYTDGGNGYEFTLTEDERDRARDAWERLE